MSIEIEPERLVRGVRNMSDAREPSASLLELSHPSSGQKLILAPGAGFCGLSWMVNDQEYLHLDQPMDRFLREEHTGGLPLLYPWANRLRDDHWTFEDIQVDLAEVPRIHRDSNGRPMHGNLLRWSQWETSATDGGCMAHIDWQAHDELMQAFPFDHQLRIQWTLDSDGLHVRTSVTAGATRVPISFGWHPYLVLPGVARDDITLDLPELKRRSLDDSGLPMKAVEDTTIGGTCAIREKAWDDCFSGISAGDQIMMRGSGKGLCMTFEEGWRYMQIYSPEGADYVCIEPMTSVTASLSDQDSAMPVVDPGCTFVTAFRINVLS